MWLFELACTTIALTVWNEIILMRNYALCAWFWCTHFCFGSPILFILPFLIWTNFKTNAPRRSAALVIQLNSIRTVFSLSLGRFWPFDKLNQTCFCMHDDMHFSQCALFSWQEKYISMMCVKLMVWSSLHLDMDDQFCVHRECAHMYLYILVVYCLNNVTNWTGKIRNCVLEFARTINSTTTG